MKKRQSHHGGTVFICTRIFRGFTIHDSSFPIPDSTSKAAFFGFFFVADEGVTDGDFESAFEDDAAFVALADFVGIGFVALEVLHFALADDFIPAFDFKERTAEQLAF